MSSPWGETVDATTFRVLGIRFFNPYSVDRREQRALLRVAIRTGNRSRYGRVIPIMQYGAASRAGLVPVTVGGPNADPGPVGADTLAVLTLVYLTEWTRWHRLHRLPAPAKHSRSCQCSACWRSKGLCMWIYRIPLGNGAVSCRTAGNCPILLLPNNLLVVTIAGAVPAMGSCNWLMEKQLQQVRTARTYSATHRLGQDDEGRVIASLCLGPSPGVSLHCR